MVPVQQEKEPVKEKESQSPSPAKETPGIDLPPPSNGKPKIVRKTPKLSDLVNKSSKEETSTEETQLPAENNPYTNEQLQQVWNEFAEKRKTYQAEYQLLTQPFDRTENLIVIHLHNPIQETILNTFKSDFTSYIRERLKNSFINISGEFREEDTKGKKVFYTPKEKFEYLLEKNPMLKELKDRLGLDPDF